MTSLTSVQVASLLGVPIPQLWSLMANPKAPQPSSTDGEGNLTWALSPSATVTISIAAPGVVSWTAHGLPIGTPVVFSTTGALPTGLVNGGSTPYYVSATGYGTNSFAVSTTQAGALAGTGNVTTTGSQSGVQTCAAPPILAFVAQYLAAKGRGWKISAAELPRFNFALGAANNPGAYYSPPLSDPLFDDFP